MITLCKAEKHFTNKINEINCIQKMNRIRMMPKYRNNEEVPGSN